MGISGKEERINGKKKDRTCETVATVCGSSMYWSGLTSASDSHWNQEGKGRQVHFLFALLSGTIGVVNDFTCGRSVRGRGSRLCNMEFALVLAALAALLHQCSSILPQLSQVHTKFEFLHSFKGPYLIDSNGNIPFWTHGGSKEAINLIHVLFTPIPSMPISVPKVLFPVRKQSESVLPSSLAVDGCGPRIH